MWIGITVAVVLGLWIISRLVRRGIRLLLTLIAVAFVVSIVSGTSVCWNAPKTKTSDPDYAVLLGCALENGQATDELVRRMEMGLDWLNNTNDTVLMLTGGDPAGQGITEAQVMYDWLTENGADMNRVVMEDRSADTRQNLLFCKELAQTLGLGTEKVLILSSEYHQTRAQYLAEKLGQVPSGLSCATPFFDRVSATVREVYSFAKAFLETM